MRVPPGGNKRHANQVTHNRRESPQKIGIDVPYRPCMQIGSIEGPFSYDTGRHFCTSPIRPTRKGNRRDDEENL